MNKSEQNRVRRNTQLKWLGLGAYMYPTACAAHRLHVPQIARNVVSFNDLDVDPE
jgi:hypothetical protein